MHQTPNVDKASKGKVMLFALAGDSTAAKRSPDARGLENEYRWILDRSKKLQ